jgi:hypothetical protein
MNSQQYMPSAPPSILIDPSQSRSLPSNINDRMRKFEYIVNRYEINREFATRLRALEGYEVVFIVDGKRRQSSRDLFDKIHLFSSRYNHEIQIQDR